MQCRLRDPQRHYNLVYTHVGTIPQSSQCNLTLFLTLNDLSLLAARHCNDSGAIGRGICMSEIDRRTIKAHVPLRHLRPYAMVKTGDPLYMEEPTCDVDMKYMVPETEGDIPE